jgi:tRNA (mo5U34)-methyltransferase
LQVEARRRKRRIRHLWLYKHSPMSLLRRVVSRVGRKVRARARGILGATLPPTKIPDEPEARDLYDRVNGVPFWFHSIDLGMGVTTPGLKSPEAHSKELASLHLPDLRGKSVLDIGAWDGFYSFAAERLGAARVVALDHHVWGLDREAKNTYKAECKAKGILQQHPKSIPWLWRFDELPGKRGFDLAHAALQSRVEAVVCDLMEMEAGTVGQFDIVLFLGVLYHMENPLESLRRLRKVTKGVAVIETEAVAVGGFADSALCEFFPPGAKLCGDPTNFWSPNAPAFVGLCETAGFSSVELLTTPPIPGRGKIARYRLVAHAHV